ncbi:permease [Propionicimonas sp.]|uniref:permease n=1 Tax=Propionicimonas sp. TaxID=1955623 RepID=UPI00181C30E0|nr:permease [Propionicimonas sp.]MBU3976818.1 permease [Actinomycetota bacterium]MBA3019507.1 permease [Propionicimonas sp.]MBU3986913.1 permease [Actinomycetota bacterium]MBU4006825.1 permease [Actinomycetota bacterium]MBU4065525.1 permease [Actinomycetota bacterium]
MTTTTAPSARRQSVRRWGGLALAAAVWWALYLVNEPFWNWLIGGAIGLDLNSRLGSGVHFFFFDTVKIALLLIGIIFLVTVLRSFMTVERTRALLGGKREGVGNVMAAGLGVVTPFCSCSAVPAFIGFVASGVPLGVTMSFLIASPLVNEVAIALLLGLFGPGPTLMYVGAGLVIAIVAGMVIGRLKLERWVEPFVFETKLRGQVITSTVGLTWDDRIQMGIDEVISILRGIWPYLLVGIGLGAAIHGWAPEDFFATYAGADNPFAVLIAVLVGVPLYSNAAGVLPIVDALYAKGLPMGTLLAFMMATVALSVPEMILLRRVLKPKLIAVFVSITALGIVAVGYLFNAVL